MTWQLSVSSTRFYTTRKPLTKDIVSILYEVAETKRHLLLNQLYHRCGFQVYVFGERLVRESKKFDFSTRIMYIYKKTQSSYLAVGGIESNLRLFLGLQFITARGILKGFFVLFSLDLLEQSFHNAIYEQPPNKHSQLFEFQARVLSYLDLLTREARLLEQFGDLDSEGDFLEEAA